MGQEEKSRKRGVWLSRNAALKLDYSWKFILERARLHRLLKNYLLTTARVVRAFKARIHRVL